MYVSAIAHTVGRGHTAGAIAAAPVEARLGVGDVVEAAVQEGQHVAHAPSVGRGHPFVAMLQHLCDGLSTKQREPQARKRQHSMERWHTQAVMHQVLQCTIPAGILENHCLTNSSTHYTNLVKTRRHRK
jgi:hypothetical protein